MRVFISPVPTLASTPTLHVAMNTTQHHRHQLPTQCLFFFTSSMGLFLLSFSSYMRRPRGSPVIGEHSEYFVTNRSRFAYMAIFKSGCTLIDSPPWSRILHGTMPTTVDSSSLVEYNMKTCYLLLLPLLLLTCRFRLYCTNMKAAVLGESERAREGGREGVVAFQCTTTPFIHPTKKLS